MSNLCYNGHLNDRIRSLIVFLKIEFINFKMYNDICESACLGGVFESE